MSTTRPYSPGDYGPEPGAEGASGAVGEADVLASRDAAATVPLAPPGAGDVGPAAPGVGRSAGDAGRSAGEPSTAATAGPVPTDSKGPGAPGPAPSGPDSGGPTSDARARGLDEPGRMSRRLSLRGESGVVPLARDFTRQALYAWGWMPAATADQRAAAEDVLLVVSELVTNACLHAEGPEELWIGSDRKVLRIEVTDRGSGQPAPRTPHRAGRPGGHGMFIVQRLCLDWGVLRASGVPGKTVWAELAAPS